MKFKWSKAQEKAKETLASRAGHNALGGGSRSGKTFLLVFAVLVRALKAPGSRHVIFRFTFKSVKSAIVLDTLPKVLKLCFPSLPSVDSMLDKTDWYLRLPNGSEVWFSGLDDAERVEKILGMEFATIYFNECSQIPWHSIETALTRLAQSTGGILQLKAYYDFNPPSKRHWTYLRFVEKKNPVTKLPEKDPYNFTFYLINPADNKENLPPEYLDFLDGLSDKKRNRFLLGKFADEGDNLLWTVEMIAATRHDGTAELPEWKRVVIAIDPSGNDGMDEKADEVGIVVVALGADGHGYLLEDLTGAHRPEAWGKIVNDAFRRHHADIIVGEKNFGGDMVRAVVHSVNSDLPFKAVNASRGKTVRAQPISSLYDQGKIHHVGYFPELEDELCSMTDDGFEGLGSPNRVDANVWGFTELFPRLTEHENSQNWRPPVAKTLSRKASRL